MLAADRLKKPSQSKRRRAEDLFLRTETEESEGELTQEDIEMLYSELVACVERHDPGGFCRIAASLAVALPSSERISSLCTERVFQDIQSIEMYPEIAFEVFRTVCMFFPQHAEEFRARKMFSPEEIKKNVIPYKKFGRAKEFIGGVFDSVLVEPESIHDFGIDREVLDATKKELEMMKNIYQINKSLSRVRDQREFILFLGRVSALTSQENRRELFVDRKIIEDTREFLQTLKELEEWPAVAQVAEAMTFFSHDVEFSAPGVIRIIRPEKQVVSQPSLPQVKEY